MPQTQNQGLPGANDRCGPVVLDQDGGAPRSRLIAHHRAGEQRPFEQALAQRDADHCLHRGFPLLNGRFGQHRDATGGARQLAQLRVQLLEFHAERCERRGARHRLIQGQ